MKSAANTPAAETPKIDRVFDVLAHRYRRWLVSYMIKLDKQEIPLATAVNVIAFFDPLSSRDSAYQELKHNHLRRLDLAGIVEFDAEREVISLVANPMVEQLIRDTIEWDPLFAEFE